jgi:transposase
MPAQYVKAYLKRNKNDAADAAAICDAVVRPTMRFVAVKTAEQQAAVLLHRGRERLVRQRTGLVNVLRASCWQGAHADRRASGRASALLRRVRLLPHEPLRSPLARFCGLGGVNPAPRSRLKGDKQRSRKRR